MQGFEIKIRALRPVAIAAGPNWDAIASFDAEIGDFRVRNGLLKRSAVDGRHIVALGAHKDRRLTLPAMCETRDRLVEAVLEIYEGREH
ncbi:hypothetical protein [Mesorhizobium sp. 1M-11]|uniref:hypothetical protein n=1 Tax=Mesorhizobium sp. 1M-11 TaxID=1529006 RepID=UPI0006C7406F|nr:hypothetical protein [Mesorhizobium sp. 1M-11]